MRPVSLFISYARKDENFRKELGAQLRVLERLKIIRSWHDRLILPGSDWSREIDQQIDQADIVLCLVSAHFFDSDYCWEKEMTRALARHSAEQAVVIPILIRPVAWDQTPLAALQGLPPGMIPISESPSRDAAWKTVVEGIMEVAQGIFGARQRVLSGFTAIEDTRDPSVVPPVIREVTELLRAMNLLPGDEDVVDETHWHDLTLLRVHAPVVARAVEDYRRAHAQFSIWVEGAIEAMKSSRQAQAVAVPFTVITTLTAESTRRKLGLKLLEANALIAFEDGRANGSPGVRSLLDPARYGFARALPALNDHITSEMSEYANLVAAAEESLKVLKHVIATLLKVLKEP